MHKYSPLFCFESCIFTNFEHEYPCLLRRNRACVGLLSLRKVERVISLLSTTSLLFVKM